MNKTTVAQQAKTASFLPPAQGILQRKCACGNYTVAGGKCAECAKKKNGLQRKLTIGASNDPLEREADRVADRVMATTHAHSAVSGSPRHIQRYTGRTAEGTDTAPASVDRVLASSGRPLEPALQQDMEQRFGHDFSRVRVHSGATAEQSARELNAHAYTVGHDIIFGAGEYRPTTRIGMRLLAHELAHVVQQPGGLKADGLIQRASGEAEGGDPLETEARRAEEVTEGNGVESEGLGDEVVGVPSEPTQSAATCPVTAVFSHIVVGAQKAGCQVPAGQNGASKLAHFRLTGVQGTRSVTITEQFKALDDPYSAIGLLKPNSYAATNAEFDDCYILASPKPLPSDFVLKVEQNHLYNGQVISKNQITYTPNNITFRACKRLPEKCDFASVCRL